MNNNSKILPEEKDSTIFIVPESGEFETKLEICIWPLPNNKYKVFIKPENTPYTFEHILSEGKFKFIKIKVSKKSTNLIQKISNKDLLKYIKDKEKSENKS